MIRLLIGIAFILFFTTSQADEVSDLIARGEEIFSQPGSCATCHAEDGKGLIGPDITYGPTPYMIWDQLDSNPQMKPLYETLEPSDDDLVAISTYLNDIAGNEIDDTFLTILKESLAGRPRQYAGKVVLNLSPRDKLVEQIKPFSTVVSDWQRKAIKGPSNRSYETTIHQTWERGDEMFKPEAGMVYFYEAAGKPATYTRRAGSDWAKSSQVIVGDAATKKIIASREIPLELYGQIHTTVMSPDGRYVYITGAKAGGENLKDEDYGKIKTNTMLMSSRHIELRAPATMLKVDALTLNPVAQIAIGGRLHHGQVFQDQYLLLDTFVRDDDGLDLVLYDPDNDTVVGGLRNEDLGGYSYTAYNDGEYIYLLMEPKGTDGFVNATKYNTGKLAVLRPFWVAKIDPTTWEILREYPYPGYRGDWIVIDAKKEYMYIPAGGTSSLHKINLETGVTEWTANTGPGPYGMSLTADGNEAWVSNRGETAGFKGRTITVVNTQKGFATDTLFSLYGSDHILLAPNGKEFWLTSNREHKIGVFDAKTKEMTHAIEMPGYGDPHGLVFVHYDDNGKSRVVRDQGGFVNGVNPYIDKALDY